MFDSAPHWLTWPDWLQGTYIGAMGLVVGSFLNVVIARLPEGESIVFPGSRCPRCRKAIAWYDNLPVLSWLLLRGRCRRCRAPIALRYPLVELLNAALWLALWSRLGPSWLLLAWLVLASALLVVLFLDIDEWWVPDVITYPAMLWAFAWSLAPGGLSASGALLGLLPAAGLWAFAWLFERLTHREGMGLGDIKLLAALGLALGALDGALVLVLASIQGAVLGSIVVLAGGHRARDDDPGAHDDDDLFEDDDDPDAPSDEPALAPAAADLGDDEEDDWRPHRRAVPFGPFLVLATFEVVLLPEVFRALPALVARALGALP